MLKKFCFLVFSCLPSLVWADEQKIHCPSPDRIVLQSIPGSIHSVYTATSDEGYSFGYFGLAFANPKDLNFFAAEISEVNNYWRFDCAYEKSGMGLPLESRDDPDYQNCHFPDGTQSCRGTIEECVLLCPADSIKPDAEPVE